jgi:hypothetical protein
MPLQESGRCREAPPFFVAGGAPPCQHDTAMLPRPLTTFAAAALLACATPGYAGPINDRIYPAPKVALTLEGTPAGTAAITVVTRDGLSSSGLVLAAQSGRPTLLVFHGNGSSAATLMRWFAPLAAKGMASSRRNIAGTVPMRANLPNRVSPRTPTRIWLMPGPMRPPG